MEQEKTEKKSSNVNQRFFMIGLGAILAVSLVVVLVVGLFRVYRQTANDKFTYVFASVLRLPAMKIGGNTVLYKDYLDDSKAMRTFVNFKNSTGAQINVDDATVNDQVLLRLASNVFLTEAAKKYSVSVSKEDMDNLVSEMLKQFKTTKEADDELQKMYGWNMETYKIKVMEPYLLQQKLSEIFKNDEKLKVEIKNRAQDALAQVQAGKDFAALAKELSEDPGSAANGGDLGYFSKGQMVPEFEKAAFSLKPGDISKELVETSYGFHIIKVEDKKVNKIKNDQGKLVSQEQVRARHILFLLPSLSQYLDGQMKKENIRLLIKVHDPFAELKK